jgi:hypothetical protein
MFRFGILALVLSGIASAILDDDQQLQQEIASIQQEVEHGRYQRAASLPGLQERLNIAQNVNGGHPNRNKNKELAEMGQMFPLSITSKKLDINVAWRPQACNPYGLVLVGHVHDPDLIPAKEQEQRQTITQGMVLVSIEDNGGKNNIAGLRYEDVKGLLQQRPLQLEWTQCMPPHAVMANSNPNKFDASKCTKPQHPHTGSPNVLSNWVPGEVLNVDHTTLYDVAMAPDKDVSYLDFVCFGLTRVLTSSSV